MAKITINEISRNYTYSAGNSAFCSVALPITACWGPAFEDPTSAGVSLDEMLEATTFQHFASTQEGLEAFTATYRGPAANYRAAQDYSYNIAVTLLTQGYDLDVCRVCAGTHASGRFDATIGTSPDQTTGTFTVRAKYPGSFGNNLIAILKKVSNRDYWNLITYIVDATGASTAVENLVFVFDLNNSTDAILHISELKSNFFDFTVSGIEVDTGVVFTQPSVQLTGGSDRPADGTAAAMMADAVTLATARYGFVTSADVTQYKAALDAVAANSPSVSKASTIKNREWNFNAAYQVLEILTDKLAYNSKRMILPGWDDQDIEFLMGEKVPRLNSISPLHARMMEVSANSRCCAALLDIPKSLLRSGVWVDSTDASQEGYAQKVSRFNPSNVLDDDGLFATHSALFAPWCQYKYAGTVRNLPAPPAFLALMIQIAMLKNQSLQYEWAMPTTRKHNLAIGAPDYIVPKKLLDNWQSIEGVSLNVITNIPDMGMTLWGNSTLMDVPVATYNALQNLSTRYLFDAIKDVAYRCGVGITFQYNNQEAYSKFYAGCSPLLDTMLSVGAITKYTISMSKDINGLDSVNINSVVGQIVIWVEGIINNITIDLIALPAGTENM